MLGTIAIEPEVILMDEPCSALDPVLDRVAASGGLCHLFFMSVRFRDVVMGGLDELRYEPIEKRIRGTLAGRSVVDTTRAMLVWEPGRVVPSYAVPVEDIDGNISTAGATASDYSAADGGGALDVPQVAGRPVLDPSIPFSFHTTDGEPLAIAVRGAELDAAAFEPVDDALAG